MNLPDPRERKRLDEETPGSQGEIEAGSEGDFGGPPRDEGAPDDIDQDPDGAS